MEDAPAVEHLDERDRELLRDRRIAAYWPSERLAIVEFRLTLYRRYGRHVELTEALTIWEDGAATDWRREKMRLDGQRQLEEIERHKYCLSQELGLDVGWERAADDWIESHAAQWRAWWELQPESRPGV
ncbi:MAG: hypothetical protein O7J95_06685 [Planctomycetota bacterium]|nr:hypothetical protein [Planctomycetota bacterium]